MTYTIDVEYTTGHSLASEVTNDTVGAVWEDLEEAKAAMNSLVEHYNAYKEANGYSRRVQFDVRTIEKEPWFDKGSRQDSWQYSVIVTVNGEDFHLSPFWCGYFETLHELKIVTQEDPSLSMRF